MKKTLQKAAQQAAKRKETVPRRSADGVHERNSFRTTAAVVKETKINKGPHCSEAKI